MVYSVEMSEQAVRVVLCDDHSIVRDGLEQLLNGYDGITVVGTAGDGAQGVEQVCRLDPDVVLMDLSMPVLDGAGAIRALTAGEVRARVVALTSFADDARVLEAIDAGACGYLLKDAEADELVRAIRAAARGESPLHPRAAGAILRRTAPPAQPAAELTSREREVLALVGVGLPNKLIARRLQISEATVKAHLTRIYRQLGVTDRTQAALWATDHGMAAA